jgi:hypothetical protein
MVVPRIVNQKSGTRGSATGAFSNVRAASMHIQCIYTTKYLKQRSQAREDFIQSSFYVRMCVIIQFYLKCSPPAPSAEYPDRPSSSTDNNFGLQRHTSC